MSVIIRTAGNIGPFKTIETLGDRLRCDGTDYPISVLGAYTISDDNTLAPASLAKKTVAQIDAEFEAEIAAITSAYPASEREGWPQQQQEAEAFLADAGAATPILDAIIAQTGETKAALSNNIAQKAATFSALYGAALGRKRKKLQG